MPRGKPYSKRAAKQGNQPTQTQNKKEKEIQVLIIKESGQQTTHTLRVPLNCKETDIVSSVFSDTEMMKDAFGNQMIEQSKVRVSAAHNLMPDNKSYVVQVTSPMVRAEVNIPCISSSANQYLIQIQSSTAGFSGFQKFGDLLYSNRFSDVTLCVEGKDIYAHKMILANKSPVFEGMLANKQKRIEIIDSTYETFLDLLHFVYKGYIVDSFADNVFGKYSNLMKSDDIYCVDNLKELCELKLSSILSTDNVLMCLVLADLHNAFMLKQRALDFIVKNAKLILEMPSYQSFAKMNPDLVSSILEHVVVKT